MRVLFISNARVMHTQNSLITGKHLEFSLSDSPPMFFHPLLYFSSPQRTCSLSCLPTLLPPDVLTSDLLLQAQDHRHGLVQHQQLGLWLLALQVQLTHVPQLLEGLVDVPHAQTFTGVVGHPPLALAFHLLLGAQVLVLMVTTTTSRYKNKTEGSWMCKTYLNLSFWKQMLISMLS